jgi:hypothetical protein
MARLFIPKVGSRVKLRSWDDYANLDGPRDWHARFRESSKERRAAIEKGLITLSQSEAIEDELEKQHAEYLRTHDTPGTWAWFDVLEARPETCRLRHTSRAVNAPDPAWEGWVPTEQVQAPLGWEPVYTIFCKDKAQAEKVVAEWFGRGISVWTNHDMSSATCGSHSFMPADGPLASPSWRHTGEPTEVVPPALCPSVFIVKVLEQWEPRLPEDKKERATALAELRETATVEYSKQHQMWWAERETLIYQPEE